MLSAGHDGRIVADAVEERPFTLVLTGTAGGRFESGAGGEEHTVDAVEFGRLLSGRGAGTGLLSVPVPF